MFYNLLKQSRFPLRPMYGCIKFENFKSNLFWWNLTWISIEMPYFYSGTLQKNLCFCYQTWWDFTRGGTKFLNTTKIWYKNPIWYLWNYNTQKSSPTAISPWYTSNMIDDYFLQYTFCTTIAVVLRFLSRFWDNFDQSFIQTKCMNLRFLKI